jgi:hypothetical protein
MNPLIFKKVIMVYFTAQDMLLFRLKQRLGILNYTKINRQQQLNFLLSALVFST